MGLSFLWKWWTFDPFLDHLEQMRKVLEANRLQRARQEAYKQALGFFFITTQDVQYGDGKE